jgi:hypothetical protein
MHSQEMLSILKSSSLCALCGFSLRPRRFRVWQLRFSPRKTSAIIKFAGVLSSGSALSSVG